MKKNIEINDDDTINIFVPLEIKRRGGSAVILVPKNANQEDDQKRFDEKIIKSFAKAYKWKIMLEEGQAASLAEIKICPLLMVPVFATPSAMVLPFLSTAR